MISDRTADAIAWLVAGIWATNIVAGMFRINGWQSDPGINGIFMGTVGLAFAARAMVKSRNSNDKSDDKDAES